MNTEKQILSIDIQRLKPSKYNVRIDLGDLNSLVESIRQNGILEPLIVREIDGEYEVVAGRRRYEAAKTAGLEKIPCIVVDVSDEEAVILSAVENVQRNNLTKMEIAQAFKKAREVDSKLSYKEFANRIGISRSYLHDLLVAYDVFEILKKRNVVKSFKTNLSEDEKEEGVVSASYLKNLGYTVKAVEDKIPEEEKEEKIVELAEFTKHLPSQHAEAVFKKFKEEPEKDVEDIVADVLGKVEYEKKVEHGKGEADAKPGRMSVDDPEHSIFDYIHYLIDLLEKNRRGKLNYVEKIVFTSDTLTIYFSGYNEYIPRDFRISLRHEVTGSGRDMVVATLREDKRSILDIFEDELDSKERKYRLTSVEKTVETKEYKPITESKPVKRYWEISIFSRSEMMDVFYSLTDKDQRAVWSALMNAPFLTLSEDGIFSLLRHRGYSKENARNLMREIREEWLDMEWIKVREA